ncbi:MAG: helix-turn-helix domain-containing protein, partial [Syntrophomonadaceae bacterium]|nr:helix-turn-helix domain-containing protein [Syntrophomonadaceae bacterium]
MLEIGKTLREAREAKNLTLAEAEEATKIRKYYLSALEAEDFQALPGQVYAIGFIKNYARFLGLDANILVDAFKAREDAPPLPLQTTPKTRHRPRPSQEKGASWIEKHGWKTALLLLAAVLAFFWLAESGYLKPTQPV